MVGTLGVGMGVRLRKVTGLQSGCREGNVLRSGVKATEEKFWYEDWMAALSLATLT